MVRGLVSFPATSYNDQTISFEIEGNEPLVNLSLLHRRRAFLLCASLFACTFAHAATKWQDPTPAELSMTSQPEVPGAAAVILSQDEIVDDFSGTWTYAFRIKILTQAGRDHYSNVSVQYPSQSPATEYTIISIAARTIHPDGSVVPFTGKPFDRNVLQSSGITIREKVISLPDVQIGSILEYGYTIQLNAEVTSLATYTHSFIPSFYPQTELFARQVSFVWHTNQWPVALTSSLPGGTSAIKVKRHSYTNTADISIDLQDVMPVVDEPDMPPRSSLAEKVIFYTQLPSTVHNVQDFWNETGKIWSTYIDKFIGPSSALSKPAAAIIAGASTSEDKLRRLYAAVQQMQNTSFYRNQSQREQKATGVSEPTSALDVFRQKRGNDLQLTYLFVGLARAAGFKAYVMAVTNRDLATFEPELPSLGQLGDDVAIIDLDGKTLVLDPAEPFCPFQQLLWTHSNAGGLRQTAAGTALALSPTPDRKDSDTRRVANLTIDLTGHESGTVDIAFSGAPALFYRQSTLLDDLIALHQALEDYLRNHMPKGTDVVLKTIENLDDETRPLIVHFQVAGPFATPAGKRQFVPAQLFQAGDTPRFPNPSRTLPIVFSYPEIIHDAVRLQYPPTWTIDAAPAEETDTVPDLISSTYQVQLQPSTIVLRRIYVLSATTVEAARYPELRRYDDKVTTKGHEMILFHLQPTP